MTGLRPHEILGIEAATLGNANTLLSLVGFIVAKAREVYHFRKDCLELANSCIALTATFEEAANPRDNIKSEQDFRGCLRDVQLFADECSQANIMHVAWELIGARKLAGLKARLANLNSILGTELMIRVKGDSSETIEKLIALTTDVSSVKNAVADTSTERVQYLGRINSLEGELEESRREARSLRPLSGPALQITTLPDPDVQVTKTAPYGPSSAALPLEGIFNGKPVEFRKLQTNSMDRAPRIKKVYERIAGIALVQELFRIVESDGTELVMMESMSAHQQIESVVKEGSFASLSSAHVLRYAYELAATVSALHAAGLVIKVLSDQSVYVQKQEDGSIRPKLAGLDQARALWEVTSQTPQDVRFESPETAAAGTRSRMADVWSLGVILQEIFLQQLPYGLTASEAAAPTTSEQVRVKLRNDSPIFEAADPANARDFEGPMQVVRGCLARDPFLRQTAASLAQELFEQLVLVASRVSGTPVSLSMETSTNADLEALGRRILSAEKVKYTDSANEPNSSGYTISSDELNQLVQASRMGNAWMAFLVGVAYLKNLVSTESPVGIAHRPAVKNAKAAIPFLQQAEELGHEGLLSGCSVLMFSSLNTITIPYPSAERDDESESG